MYTHIYVKATAVDGVNWMCKSAAVAAASIAHILRSRESCVRRWRGPSHQQSMDSEIERIISVSVCTYTFFQRVPLLLRRLLTICASGKEDDAISIIIIIINVIITTIMSTATTICPHVIWQGPAGVCHWQTL